MTNIEGNIIDIIHRKIFSGEILMSDGKIKNIHKTEKRYTNYILPGFVDAHVHIESSILTPRKFSLLVKNNGTIAVLNDPHEIANVMGEKGIAYMQENAKKAQIKIYFGIPSCVPATPYDANGAIIDATQVEKLASTGQFVALSEMMNVPGVLYNDADTLKKLEIAKKYHLLMDGHAPLLRGDGLRQYVNAGISTDHECTMYDEAVEKIELGMKIQIREGSAACNYEKLKELLRTHPDSVMFCTDDSHPDDIIHKGHIDKIVKRAIRDGFDLFDVLRAASYNAVTHYKMDVGLLQVGDAADFIVVDNLSDFRVLENYVNGENILESNPATIDEDCINNFNRGRIAESELCHSVSDNLRCIKVVSDQIITSEVMFDVCKLDNFESDVQRDILKIVYLNRYRADSKPIVSYITGFGLKRGAFASSIAHDSHNVLAVGCSDAEICRAINKVIDNKGGLCVVDGETVEILELPIAGIMSNKSGREVSDKYEKLNGMLKTMGVVPSSPFMTLSFMSLVVIPELKIGEKGLFSFSKFTFIEDGIN